VKKGVVNIFCSGLAKLLPALNKYMKNYTELISAKKWLAMICEAAAFDVRNGAELICAVSRNKNDERQDLEFINSGPDNSRFYLLGPAFLRLPFSPALLICRLSGSTSNSFKGQHFMA